MGHHSSLLINDSDIASREYALHSSTFVAAFCPIRVHELGDKDAVIWKDGEIAGI